MPSAATLQQAQVIWDYMRLGQEIVPAEIIVAFGSHDLRTAERAAELYLAGYGHLVVCTGGLGRITSQRSRRLDFAESEAKTYAAIIRQQGVPESKILLEEQALNTGGNITYTRGLLKERKLDKKAILFVHKPYMERRTKATVDKQWSEAHYQITSPQLSLSEFCNDDYPVDYVVGVMVGDFQRLTLFAEKGYLVAQEIPRPVQEAYKSLVADGYDQHLAS